jgi:NAD(P)H-hydrate epimerase
MGQMDREAIEKQGIPGRLLMENAGRAVASVIRSRFPKSQRPLVVCGGGNNGGDGYVVARVLRDWDDRIAPLVIALGEPDQHSPEAKENLDLILNSDIELIEKPGSKDLEFALNHCDLVVDAVLGVGLSRPVKQPLLDTLQVLRKIRRPQLAVDLPSGVSSDTGVAMGVELEPTVIVTLGLPKLGLAVRPFDAEIWVADIGLTRTALQACPVQQHLLTRSAAGALLPPRPMTGHKGTFGHVLLVAGSEGKTGAAVLAAQGALRAGAGLVTVACPRALNPILEMKLTEAMTLVIDDQGEGRLGRDALEPLKQASAERDVLVVGPGLGLHEATVHLLESFLRDLRQPAVVDADGLNAFAGRPEALRGAGARILTPHPGEAGRLLQRSVAEIQADRVAAVRELAERADAVVVLKGARSLVASPEGELLVNPTGGPGLASGGTGDVLSGVIAGLLSHGLSPFDAGGAGVFLHGLAGDLGPSVGEVAGAVCERIPDAWSVVLAPEEAGDSREPLGGAGVLRRFP